MGDQFLIEKRGLYYRPGARGYTGLKREAGRYTFEEAAWRVGPNGPDGPHDGMGMWREDEAPEFSSACAWDLKLVEERTRSSTSPAKPQESNMTDISNETLVEVERAGRPFEAAVFNDNGDVTISTGGLTPARWKRLVAALARLRAEREVK